MACVETGTAEKGRKRIGQRRGRDYSQRLRRAMQGAFLALNAWIGIEFYLWVRYYETGGASVYAPRPAGVEGWLPIASLMNLKYWVATGEVPNIHPAGMFLLLAFVGISFLLRKSFCSWLCPVGTVSEWLWRAGRSIFGRNFRLPKWADVGLRGLKYILLALFIYAVASMPAAAIRAFLDGPYGVISDVKMMNFFRHMSVAAAAVVGALALLSVFYQNFWCRFLCPYGALLGLAARFSPARIRRAPELCIDCAKCAKACPSFLPVDVLQTVRSPECTGCYECVASCPAAGALEMSVTRRRVLPAWAMAAGIVVVFCALVGYARWAGYWHTNISSETYFQLVPRAGEFQHP
jgi:polyferredoxin